MIRYIIQLKDGVVQYYAASERQVGNKWTSSANMATRWPTREAATEFVTSIRAVLNPEGHLHVREIEVRN